MDWNKVKTCAEYSYKIYDDKINYKPTCVFAKKDIDNIKLLLLKKDQTIYIVVRGSDNKQNWLLDFKYWKTWDKELGVYIHSGYKKASQKITEWLTDFLLNPVLNVYDFVFTGHSLGGAIAAICGLELADKGMNVTNIITFGQPKITNKKGAQKLSEKELVISGKYVRFINDKDIVNLLPPNSLLGFWKGKYQHFGEEYILLDNDIVSINNFKKVLKKNYSLWSNIDIHSVKEHKMINYIEKLNNLKDINKVKHSYK